MDHIFILKALNEIPFGVGKQLLLDFLNGDVDNPSIIKNHLDTKPSFGSFDCTDSELDSIINLLLKHGLIQYNEVKKYIKVLEITSKGKQEILHPKLQPPSKPSFALNISKVTDEDKNIFKQLPFLDSYNDGQKKAIISKSDHILCIAGAGSGKTTVLTKRIEFLIRYRSVNPEEILAITFTRKARSQMSSRLNIPVRVETFNSFCESILKKYNDIVYDRPVHVVDYREKFLILNKALSRFNTTLDRAINLYFSQAQKRSKTNEQLANIFLNDCFFIRDYMKINPMKLEADTAAAQLVFNICGFINDYMYNNGLRDYADQLVDTITLFKSHPELIPRYSHILIDEYQDVNSMQIDLIDLLDPKNIFAVGDPRQSIYGWRGSDIRHLINFNMKYPSGEVLSLTDNYRSTNTIVSLINASIRHMGLEDLRSSQQDGSSINLLQFDSEQEEFGFIIQKIISSNIPRSEIFVLARTNRQLLELSALMHARRIRHIIRSEELRRSIEASPDDVTLATIHAIKGLEAELVFVMGCTNVNFPCKGTEHPVVEMVKLDEYDKEEEEKRLFYVAMSRAKKHLYLTYSGSKHTSYITDEMSSIIEQSVKGNLKPSDKAMVGLKEWRFQQSKVEMVPPFIIMHDTTLNDLVQKMPKTLEELGKVHGMGPVKIKKYGEKLLEIINQ